MSGGRNGWPVLPKYTGTPEQLLIVADPEAAGMPTFPRSSWHPHRKHWPEPWRIAEYGTKNIGGRVLWNADHPDYRYEDKAWVCHVDLNTGEFKAPFHPWQRVDGTTEARRHGDVTESRLSEQAEIDTPGVVPQFNATSSLSENSVVPVSVSPCLRGESQWPEPHDEMNNLERIGFRRGPHPDTGKVDWYYGPFTDETSAEFSRWWRRVNEFFEQKPSQETKEGAAA